MINYMLNGKATIAFLTAGLTKKEPKSSGGKVKVELDLSNYATKEDLKNATGVNT